MAETSSPEQPVSVAKASRLMHGWIQRLGAIWVEGEVTELRVRRTTAWLRLRDVSTDMSIPLMARADSVQRLAAGPLDVGQRVVAQLQPDYLFKRGELQWRASQFRPVGVGALLERIEQLRKQLAAEGLFDAERKRALPFLPRSIGLIVGRRSAAEHDVVVNTTARWPGIHFTSREVSVQGTRAVPEVIEALRALDAHSAVDVIVIARGGGSTEDLIPFSNEALVRAVAEAGTPVISAIGHEEDSPLLDLVADVRASTPTDAASYLVPELALEQRLIEAAREQATRNVRRLLDEQRSVLAQATQRPVMASFDAVLDRQRAIIADLANRAHAVTSQRTHAQRSEVMRWRLRLAGARPQVGGLRRELDGLRHASRAAMTTRTHAEERFLSGQVAALRSLSPQQTLARGYAILRAPTGAVITAPDQVRPGDELLARLAEGELTVSVTEVERFER
ncbi:MAG: exodeoxyribonuclease VII large subunit [Actinobacteria bacterium]|nr:exodeoxyribonuclease VII large subunit [Actinomycetota bacterium]